MPNDEHGHLHCVGCGETWEIDAGEAASLVAAVAQARRFRVELSHLSIAGRCARCVAAES